MSTQQLVGGVSTYSTRFLTSGRFSITASYNGDSQYNPNTSNTVIQVVNGTGGGGQGNSSPVNVQNITITSTKNPSTFGDSITFESIVTGDVGTPTGVVTFYDDVSSLGVSGLDTNGKATLTKSNLTVGSHNITAKYSGDTLYNSTTSSVLVQIVNNVVVPLPPPAVSFSTQSTVPVSQSNIGDNLLSSIIQNIGADLTNTANNFTNLISDLTGLSKDQIQNSINAQ